MSKIFCTFTKLPELDNTLHFLGNTYNIAFKRIFVLYAKEQEDYLLTYNVIVEGISSFPKNTILVHRKKETNTLYTINALNTLVQQLNEGKISSEFRINWKEYRNCVLLTKGKEFRRIDTELERVVNLN